MCKPNFYFLLTVLFLVFMGCVQPKPEHSLDLSADETTRLRNLGDQYGMTQYSICMLRPGKQRLMRIEEFNAIENAHLSYLKSLADSGIIVLTGFYTSVKNPNSLVIFTSSDTAYAKEVMLKSPKIAKQLLIPEYATWYGPVALTKLHQIHQKITAPLPE